MPESNPQPSPDGSGINNSDGRVDEQTKGDPAAKSTQASKKKLALPTWLTDALRSPRQWKVFVRCMLATFGSLVLVLAQPSLTVLGSAAFFGLIMSQMLPPYMALSLYTFALMTMVVGMGLGWAWGAAAMAAGLRARDQVVLQQNIQRVQSGFNSNANLDLQYQASIFRGEFLDPRTSAVNGVFMFFGAYLFGFLRATKPRLTLAAIFGTIIMDLMVSFGPLFPNAQYTLARQLLIPAATFMAIALVSTILIFPQSLNHIVLDAIVKKPLKLTIDMLKLQEEVLSTTDEDKWAELAEKTTALRAGHVAGLQETEGQLGLLQLEVTRGQTSAADLSRIFKKLQDVGSRIYGLTTFVMLLNENNRSIKRFEGAQGAVRTKRKVDMIEKHRLEQRSFATLLPQLRSSTADLRHAAQQGLEGVDEWLRNANHSRWTKLPANASPLQTREGNLQHLRSALTEFRESKHFEMLESLKDLFDTRTGEPRINNPTQIMNVRELFRCYVFSTTLIHFSRTIIEFLELVLEIEKANPKARIQLPSAFAKKLVEAANDTDGGGNPLDMGAKAAGREDDASSTSTRVDQEDKAGAGKKAKKAKRKTVYSADPDAGDPTNAFQKFGRGVYKLWKGLSSAQGIFALKYALVSVALWIPAVAPASAQFVYENRGLWALIMAQTGLGIFTGEQIFSFITRMVATAIGLVIGMVVWYIGAPGTGNGNPYGIAAATMVFISPFLFMRIVAPPQWMAFSIMIPVTVMFTVGYSWVDTHTYQTANQGAGAGLAGRRALLVLIGFTAGFIIMLFPKPVSAKQRVRHSLARIIEALGDLYGSEIGGFELELEAEGEEGKVNQLHSERQKTYRSKAMKIFGRLQATAPQMGFAKFEPAFRGPWPAKKYDELVHCQRHIVNALALLSSAYVQLETKWVKRLAEHSDMLHPSFIADTLALFSLLHQSLQHAHPLPPTIPLFERLFYHQESKHAMRGTTFPLTGVSSRTMTTSGQDASGGQARRRRGSRASRISVIDEEQGAKEVEEEQVADVVVPYFTWTVCHDEQFAIYATATVALGHLVSSVSELHRVVRDLVGEKELEGFEIAQMRWAGLERA